MTSQPEFVHLRPIDGETLDTALVVLLATSAANAVAHLDRFRQRYRGDRQAQLELQFDGLAIMHHFGSARSSLLFGSVVFEFRLAPASARGRVRVVPHRFVDGDDGPSLVKDPAEVYAEEGRALVGSPEERGLEAARFVMAYLFDKRNLFASIKEIQPSFTARVTNGPGAGAGEETRPTASFYVDLEEEEDGEEQPEEAEYELDLPAHLQAAYDHGWLYPPEELAARERAAQSLGLMVAHADGFLALPGGQPSQATRAFGITGRLPLEVQDQVAGWMAGRRSAGLNQQVVDRGLRFAFGLT